MKHHLFLYSVIVILLLTSFVAGQLNITTTDANSTISANSTITGSTTSSTSMLPSSSTMSVPSSSIPPSATHINVTTSSAIAFPQPTVQGTGWDPNGNAPPPTKESWLKEHNRFVFIIFIGLLVLGLLLWYIIKSVKGMRKRLAEENQAHLYMMQQTSGANNNNNGNTATVRPSDAVNLESATPISPPPAYKFDDHPNNSQQQQQQQPGHSQY